MPSSSSETRKERVNLLLPSPFDVPGLQGALESDDPAERRDAVAEVEAKRNTFVQSSTVLAQQICERLAGEQDSAAAADAVGSRHLLIDELDPYVGPPESIPILNPYTAVLTVAAPEGAEPYEAVDA